MTLVYGGLRGARAELALRAAVKVERLRRAGCGSTGREERVGSGSVARGAPARGVRTRRRTEGLGMTPVGSPGTRVTAQMGVAAIERKMSG